MSDRLWHHAISAGNLECYSPPLARPALSEDLTRLVHRAREIFEDRSVPASRHAVEQLRAIFEIPERIARTTYRVWRKIPFEHSEQFLGYGVKGGAARSLLFFKLFGVHYPLSTRDVDAVRFGTTVTAKDRDLAERFSPRDASNGAGVELVQNLDQYLESRDLSVNEVMWMDGVLTASERAIIDVATLVLRPSKILLGSLHRNPSVRGRAVLKMVRLATEGALVGVPWKIIGLPKLVDISEFELAIELDKAFERGVECARCYVQNLHVLGLLPEYQHEDLLQAVVDDIRHFSVGLRAPLKYVPASMLRQNSSDE